MGRQLNSRLPVVPSQLNPQRKNLTPLQATEEAYRTKAKDDYGKRHRARDLPPLQPDQQVWIRDLDRTGEVVRPTANPRSYEGRSDGTSISRNRSALLPMTDSKAVDGSSPEKAVPPIPTLTKLPTEQSSPKIKVSEPKLASPPKRQSRCGRPIRTPKRFSD